MTATQNKPTPFEPAVFLPAPSQTSGGAVRKVGLSQWDLIWIKFRRNKLAVVAGVVLVVVYLSIFFADFISPYPINEKNQDYVNAPPMWVQFTYDGQLTRPFVYGFKMEDDIFYNPKHPYTRGLLRSIPQIGLKKRLARHPYTEALLAAIPVADPRAHRQRKLLEGTVPNPANPPPGCHFHTRCLYAQEICRVEPPQLAPVAGDSEHFASCHFAGQLELKAFVQIRAAGLLGIE